MLISGLIQMFQIIFDNTRQISKFSDDPMPSFEDSTCPSDIPEGGLCIKVNFPDDTEDLMILFRTSETSFIFEGYLQEDEDVTITLIDTPAANTRFVRIRF